MKLSKQIDIIDPSAKDALFRRLLYEENLGYLRDDKSIIGFEVVLDQEAELSGYTIIAIQKHTILAFKSDIDEPKRLILFPAMSKIEDPEFQLLNLKVERKVFKNESFKARAQYTGLLKDVAKDLIPPYKKVEVSDEMASSMKQAMKATAFGTDIGEKPKKPTAVHIDADVPFTESTDAPIDSPEVPIDVPIDAPMDVPMDVPDDISEFDEYEQPGDDFHDSESDDEVDNPSKIKPTDERSIKLSEQEFHSISQVSDYVILNLGVQSDLASNVVTAALNATPVPDTQVDVAVLLFIKLFNDKKI